MEVDDVADSPLATPATPATFPAPETPPTPPAPAFSPESAAAPVPAPFHGRGGRGGYRGRGGQWFSRSRDDRVSNYSCLNITNRINIDLI